MISHEKTTLRKLNKIESNLNEIKQKLGVQETDEVNGPEPLAGIGVIESYDFKREALMAEINSKQFKSTNFFGNKDKILGQKKQEKPQMFIKPTDITTKPKQNIVYDTEKSMKRSNTANSWTDVMQVANQKTEDEKDSILMKLKMTKMYKTQVQKDFTTFLLQL